MFPSLPQENQDELQQLAQLYGQPLVQIIDLGTTNYFDPLNKSDRYGEVCMVIRRTNGHLLTMKKTFYPEGGYRLLTGGINHGERIYDALLRETHEETGLTVKITRFLVAAAYCVTNVEKEPAFYTFAFLLDEIGGTLGAIDEEENVEAFLEIKPKDLLTQAEFLEQIRSHHSKELNTDWSAWGHFRAVIHRLVWQALPA